MKGRKKSLSVLTFLCAFQAAGISHLGVSRQQQQNRMLSCQE